MKTTSDTGTFQVYSKILDKTFLVECIGNPYVDWGDVDPASKKVTGDYGNKYRGSIDGKDSVITPENGYKNIITLGVGESPLGYIYQLEQEHLAKNK